MNNAHESTANCDSHWSLADALAVWLARHPEGAAVAQAFAALAAEGAHAHTRERLEGHFTASCWLVSAEGTRVLLTHHSKLGRWLQLGGHADGDTHLPRAALKEAEEESGLPGLQVEQGIFDLDKHWIPARPDVPGHWHYDVRFVVRAGADEQFTVSEESLDLAWRDIAELAADAQTDASLQRMARRWLARHG